MMMNTVTRLIVAGALCLAASSPSARAQERFDVTRVADGVYLISRTEVLKQPLDGNTVVIVGAEGVAVVDSTQTSTSAKAVIAEIRRLTPVPVKYLVNTHWHNDHVLGNGAYVAAFPGVQIVAHELTREDIASEAAAVLANRIRGLENRNQAQATLDAGRTPAGVPLSRADIHRLRERLAMPASHLEDLKAIVVTPPTVTYRGRMTMQLGGREVQLFSNGPANTRSDTVVWLPKERVVASGDLLVSTVPFMSVSFPRGWLARLKEIEALTPLAIIPGHGPVQRDLTWLHRHASLLESLITQVDAALDKGLTLDQTQQHVNLDAFRNAYAGGDKFLSDEFDFRVTEPAVVDAYRERLGQTVPTDVPPEQTMTMTRVADGVYAAIYSEMVRDPVQSNALIVIGKTGVCVVDTHYTPSAARATIAAIRSLTSLPVRYVVTTHSHDDHVFGNKAYRDAFPGVQFVAHDETRAALIASADEHRRQLVTSYTAAIPRAEERLKSGIDADGKPLSAERRADIERRLPVFRAYLEDFTNAEIVMPTLTFADALTLDIGEREVQVRFLGRGNTTGDTVVYLPKERIAAVGDLVVYPVPFIYGGFPASWVDVLKSVRALGVETIVPGHGPVMRDFSYVDRVSSLMASLAAQAKAAVSQGLSLEAFRKIIDLSASHDLIVGSGEGREGTFQASIVNAGVKAAYDEARTRAGGS